MKCFKFAAAGVMALFAVAAQAKMTESDDLYTSHAGRGAVASLIAAKPFGSDGRRMRISDSRSSSRALTFAGGSSSAGAPWAAHDRADEMADTLMGGGPTFVGRVFDEGRSTGAESASKAMSGGAISDLTFRSAVESDDFRVTSVPEPETYALMLTGLCALVVVVRRRRT